MVARAARAVNTWSGPRGEDLHDGLEKNAHGVAGLSI
jgi:hypothetical protein